MSLSIEEAADWAEAHAAELRGLASAQQVTGGSLAPATDFLRVWAGPASEFYRVASSTSSQLTLSKSGSNSNAARSMADALELWVSFQRAGMAEGAPFEVLARSAAATDLMEQVRFLLDDPKMHPAAPVMLAGSALEEVLRGLVERDGLSIKGKPGINSYASALRGSGVLTAQQKKDIDSVGGLRNSAAHGEFDEISREAASLMEQHVNLLLANLTPT